MLEKKLVLIFDTPPEYTNIYTGKYNFLTIITIMMVSSYQWNWIDSKLQENHKEEIVSNVEILDTMQGTAEVNRPRVGRTERICPDAIALVKAR